jgi:GNAT superfamily N-acetyltransferase
MAAKRRADEPPVPQPQDGDFHIHIKVKKHYEFDWIEIVRGFVEMPKQNQEDAVAHTDADSGSSSRDSKEDIFDDFEDSNDLENFDNLEASDDLEDEDEDDLVDEDEDETEQPNEYTVGACSALLISNHRSNFYDDMEEPSVESSKLAFDLFDRYGRLRPEFKTHPFKKGSGIWKDELDSGPILLIEDLLIDKPYRCCGIGQKMMITVLEEMRSKSEQFVALTLPGIIHGDYRKLKENLTDEERKRFFDEELRVAIAFWRSVGFRRIGSSKWFGLASAVDHSYHSLSASEDYDPPMPPNRIRYSAMGSLLTDIATMEENEGLERVK